MLERKLNTLMDDDSIIIKLLIIKNLSEIHVSYNVKQVLFKKAVSDLNYLVRIKAEEYFHKKICSEKLNAATESVNKILDENGNLNDFEVTE